MVSCRSHRLAIRQSWSTNRCCALFSIVFASLVGGDYLVFGSSVYFFDVLPSAQCVDRPVVHVGLTFIGFVSIKGWIDAFGWSEANVASTKVTSAGEAEQR